MRLKWLAAAWAALIIPAPGLAPAQERQAETMVVTAARLEEPERLTPQAMTVIGPEVLEKNQYADLAGLLQNYGFNIISYGPSQSSSQISIRGMDTAYSNPFDSNVLLLLDGAPLASTNLSMIPMEGIERIEILRGPGAVQYGSSAVGGVINIIPRRGAEKPSVSAEIGAGSWYGRRALAAGSGRAAFLDFAAAVGWNAQANNYTTGDGTLYPDTSASGRLGYLVNLGLNFNDENRLGLLLSGMNDWGLGLAQSLETATRHPDFDASLRQINSSADVNYHGASRELGLDWKLRYFNAYNQANYTYPANNPLSYDNYSIFVNQAGGQGQLAWNWNFLTLSGGVDYTESSYSSGFAPRYTQKDLAGYVMARLAFLDDLVVISGGLRHDAYTFRVQGRERDMGKSSLSGGIALNPLDWLTLRANIGQSFKAPSGLYVVGYASPTGSVTGNPDLDPEQGLGWDAGADIHWRGLKVALSYFETAYRDKITSGQTPLGSYFYYNASGTSHYRGLEGQIGLDLGELFDWDFSLRPYFNFTGMLQYTNPAGSRLNYVRDFVAAYGLAFSWPDWGLDMDLRLNYLGYQKEQVWDASYNSSEKRSGGKTVADFFISKTILDLKDGGKFSVKGEVRNLSNENYACHYGYPLPGRSFYVGLRYDF